MNARDGLMALAQICDVFPQARLGGAILADGRVMRSGANALLAKWFGAGWVKLSGERAIIACCWAVTLAADGALPRYEP